MHMNGIKNCTMNSELHSGEESDHEMLKIKEEKQNSRVTLDKMELTESDNKCHLLQDKKDTESLESIQNYAQRIKSFLGWEPNEDEQELKNELNELKTESLDGDVIQKLSSSPECVDKKKYLSVENFDISSAISESEESAKKKCENNMDCIENDKKLNNAVEGENTDYLFEKSGESIINRKDEEIKEPYVIPEREDIETDFENNNVIHMLSDRKKDLLKNSDMSKDSININKDLEDSAKTVNSTAESDSINAGSSCVLQEDLKLNEYLSNGSITDNNTFEINSDDNVSSGKSSVQNKSAESQGYNALSLDNKNSEELDKDILPESVHCDDTNVNTEKIHELEKGENESSKNEVKDLRDIKKGRKELDLSDNSEDNEGKKNSEEIDSSCVYESEDYEGKLITKSVFESTKDSSSDVGISERKNMDENFEPTFGDMSASFPEINLGLNTEDKKDNDTNNNEKGSIESSTNDIRNGKNETEDADDLRSEDSLDLDDNLPLEKNLPKHYVKEIRRLSRDIVRDVIESARSSVHELYTSKTDNLHNTSLPENLANYDLVKDFQEFCFNNGKQNEGAMSDSYEKFSKENLDNNLNHSIENEQDIEDKETICGFGCFKPRWIQKYATSRAYLILFSIIGVIHGCYYAYIVSILSTLEKRYAFKTKVSGTLLLADEITPLILGILVGYIGGKTHRPRMVAIGMFMSAACCFISGLPYLIYGTLKHISYFDGNYEAGPKFCKSGINATQCNSDEQPPTLTVVGIFLLASFLKGFATLSYYVIGMSYMDDIIKRKNSPVYFAIALALRLLGPLVGFLMSSGFLKYYENPLYDPGFGPEDPRWIGAWWIGFFLQGILLVIFTIPIALFPRRLPGQKVLKAVSTASEDGMKEIFRGLISALKRLGKNPVFIVLIINMTMKVFGHFGHAIMLPKYMENQFKLSASEASLYSGAVSIVCMIISTILGGFLIWKFRPRIKVLLSGMVASEIILAIGFLILMIPRCQTPEMSHFGMNEDGLVLNSVCNNNCDCSTTSFTPFCGPDGKTLYFSPCYAGCTQEINSSRSSKMSKVFSNCSCVIHQQLEATISEGFCPDENCRSQMIIYLILLFVLVTVSNLFTVAGTMILLRCVHPSDKSVALGTFETFICLFGFIPFPVTFGALVDSACLVWEKSCGETGNCWFYDMDKYTYLLHGVSALFSSFCVLCLIALYFLSDRIRNLYEEEDDEEETKYVDIKLDTVSGSVTKL